MENKTYGNEPAFARASFYHPDGGYDHPQAGLTKREYFAAMAMQGILANPHQNDLSINLMVEYSVDCADLLIEQLNKDNNGK